MLILPTVCSSILRKSCCCVFLDDDYLDLRNYPDTSFSNKGSNIGTRATSKKDSNSVHTTKLKREGSRIEKESKNCGLKKVVTSYKATAASVNPPKKTVNKKKSQPKEKPMIDPKFRGFVVPEAKTCLQSHSEISVVPKKIEVDHASTSTPVVQSKKTSNIELETEKHKYEPQKNKFTMTKDEINVGRVLKPRKNHVEQIHNYSKLKECQDEEKQSLPVENEYIVNQQLDPRLCEKYSVLKMPLKRTWTIPVFTPKSSIISNRGRDNCDRQTYLYDDGTEIDSVYVESKQDQSFSRAFQNQCMTLLFLGGSFCGVILMSVFIWFIFGNDFFHKFFKVREVKEDIVTHSVKYIGGGIIHLVTTLFKTIGNVLTIPTQAVYPPQPDPH